MTRRALAGFIVINVVVSIAVAVLIILVWDRTHERDQIVVTRPFPVTSEANNSTFAPGALPDEAYQRTITALNNQSTQQSHRMGTLEAVAATSGFEVPTETPFVATGPAIEGVPTLDPAILGIITLPPGAASSGDNTGAGQTTDSATLPDDGCDRYVVESGDNCALIANQFGVSPADLIELNGINATCSDLQAGQTVRIPGPLCQLPATTAPTPTITNTPFLIGTFSITNTPAPTAESAQVQIVQILNFGDITREQVDIENTGDEVIEMEGWTLVDAQDNVFTFPRMRMQAGQIVRIFSQLGQNTPGALYWNLTSPVWQENEIATLYDASGSVQATYTVTSTTINFGN